MEMSSALIYSMRYATKLSLPAIIQENIAKLRIIPAAYKPMRPIKHRVLPKRKPEDGDNWRERTLTEVHRKIRETNDPHYEELMAIFNKVSSKTLDSLSKEAIDILNKNDESFRLRTTALLFDKAIRGSAFASIMADIAVKMNEEDSNISEDLKIHVKMFTTVYDMNETLVFPSLNEPDFEDRVVAWSKQKDVRRGYSRFLTHLYTRNLISGDSLHSSMNKVLDDLESSATQAKTEKLEENITQYADFLYEIAKLLPLTAVEMRGLIETRVGALLAKPRTELPALNMRSRFKLEDAQKCVCAI